MGKYIEIYVRDSDHKKLTELAKLENKKLSAFVREKCLAMVNNELKDSVLLERLIFKIEQLNNLKEDLSNSNSQVVSTVNERFDNLIDLLNMKEEGSNSNSQAVSEVNESLNNLIDLLNMKEEERFDKLIDLIVMFAEQIFFDKSKAEKVKAFGTQLKERR